MSYKNIINSIYHLWIDHLEIYATFLHEELFCWVDFDNSNQLFFWGYQCIKVENPRYEYQVIFTKDDLHLFSYFKWSTAKSKIATKDYVAFYSTCFRVYGKEIILNTITQLFYVPNVLQIRRFDVCIDILAPISTILSGFNILNQRGATFYGAKGMLETYYIGDKKNSTNRRHLIRVYNKKIDILKKGKNELYQDYLLEQDVTRIELEVRRELAKNFSLEELFVDENLLGLLKNYCWQHTMIFEGVDIPKISLYRKPKPVPYQAIQLNAQSLLRVRIFLWHARGLLARGLDPMYALLSQDIIHPIVREALNKTDEGSSILSVIRIKKPEWKQIIERIRYE